MRCGIQGPLRDAAHGGIISPNGLLARGEPLTQDSGASLDDKAKALMASTFVASHRTFGAPLAGAVLGHQLCCGQIFALT